MSAQSYNRGPFDPSAQLSRCHPSAGTRAASSSARRAPAATVIISLHATAITYGISCASSHPRSFGFPPYTSSPATHANGTPAFTARPIIRRASSGFVANATSSPIPAPRHRSRSPVHFPGRYSSLSMNAQVGVFLAYAGPDGSRALIDRELYLPEKWTGDRERCRGAGIGDEVAFATKPELARRMIGRAVKAGVPFAWVAGDEVYRGNPERCRLPGAQGSPYVLS